MRIADLETPALLIDLDIMERNLCRVADYAREHKLRLRPHTKTHKIPSLGKRQVELGAAGLTVAKVGEAEVMLRSGTPDLLVAYPVIGERKLQRLMARGARDARHGGAGQRGRGAAAFRRRAGGGQLKSACWRKWMPGWAASAWLRAGNWCAWRRTSCGCRR